MKDRNGHGRAILGKFLDPADTRSGSRKKKGSRIPDRRVLNHAHEERAQVAEVGEAAMNARHAHPAAVADRTDRGFDWTANARICSRSPAAPQGLPCGSGAGMPAPACRRESHKDSVVFCRVEWARMAAASPGSRGRLRVREQGSKRRERPADGSGPSAPRW